MAETKEPTIEHCGPVTVVVLGKEYDSLNGESLDRAAKVLLEAAENSENSLILVDMSNTNFFGSAFIEVLVRMWNVLESRENGRLAMCNLKPYCAEIIEVTHLDDVWEIFPDRESALIAMGS